MDFSDTSITIGALIAIAGAVWGVIRTIDWLNAKVEAAVQPLSIKASTLELRIERLVDKVTEHELHVIKNFVSSGAVQNLENRMDQGFKSMHDEMTSLRDMLIKQLAGNVRDNNRGNG